jgi:anti-sigma-K factor RskA
MSISTIEPDEIRELLGAYALGAVDADEAAQVEALLARDPLARRELAGYETATLSLHSPDGPSPDVWTAIEQAITDEPERSAVVVPLAAARSHGAPRRRVVRVAIAAAAVAALVAAAAWGIRTVDRSLPTTPASDVSRAAALAEGTPGARRVTMLTPDGDVVNLVVLPDGRGYVLGGKLPLAPDGAQYLLVGLRDGEQVLLGVLGATIETTAFLVPDGVDELVIVLTGTDLPPFAIGSASLPAPPATDQSGVGADSGDSAAASGTSGAPATGSPSSAPSAAGPQPVPSLPLPSLPLSLPLLSLPLL